MLIGVDIDGVVRDIHTPTLAWWKEISGIEKTIEDIQGWNIATWLDVDPDKHDWFYQEWFCQKSIFWGAPSVPNAISALQELSRRHRIIFITSQYGPARLMTVEWIDNNVPEDITDAVALVFDKNLIRTDVLIDDGPHNLVDRPGLCWLFDRPWNRNDEHFERVMDWDDILRRF